MEDLLQAIEIRNRYNAMSFDEFIVEYEKHFGVNVPLEVIVSYGMTGLNNVDFITSEYLKYYSKS